MSLTAILVSFGVIFVAELPDKTMVASLVLGSRYRPAYVFVGVAAAFTVHVTVAVAAGSALTLLPARIVDGVTALLFGLGAVLVFREGREADDPAGPVDPADPADPADPQRGAAGSVIVPTTTFWRVAATAFGVVFVAELGDLTQISTANLAARFDSAVAVWIGALAALWTVAGLAMVGGRGLLRVLSVRLVTRVAATAFTVLAVVSLADVIRG